MMRYLYLMCVALLVGLSVQAQPVEKGSLNTLWEEANHAYANGNYDDAINAYDSLLNQGYESEKVYYNLGNAYFKRSNIGKAILNYNKALLMAPNDEDILYNLEIAKSHTVDKIDEVPQFFVKRWIEGMRMMFNSNTWAVISLVCFVLMLSFVMLYLLSNRMFLKKMGFYSGVIFLLFFVGSMVFASRQRTLKIEAKEAVVMNNAAAVKSSPDDNSKDIFILHEGTKVKVLDQLNGWREIMIADGNKGWISALSIELIK